jgi:hypothetical protein
MIVVHDRSAGAGRGGGEFARRARKVQVIAGSNGRLSVSCVFWH